MLDPFGQRLDVAEHHRGAADASQLVPYAADIQPIVGQHLAAGEFLAHAIDQDLGPTARQAAQAGRFQPLEHCPQRQSGHLGKMMNLGRAEAVNVDLRKVRLDVVQQLFVPLERQVGMQAALHQNLIAAQIDGLLDLLQQLCPGEDVALGVFGLAKERAESRIPRCRRWCN